MSQIAKGLCWATVLIGLALANWAGLVADKTANQLFIILPIIAVLAMRGGNCMSCIRREAR